MPRLRVGLGEDRVETGDARIRDEPLRPVENVLVPVEASGRPHRRRVRARARLRQRVGGEHLTGREPRQPGRPLLVRPAQLQPQRAELLHGEDQAARRTDLRDLLDRDQREQRPRPRPTHLLAEEEAEDALVAVQLDHVPRELVRRIDLRRTRRNPLARERPHQVPYLALLVAQDVPGHATKCRRATRLALRREATPSGVCPQVARARSGGFVLGDQLSPRGRPRGRTC